MERPFASRALVVTARALEEENKELSIKCIWRLSVDLWGAGRLLIGADSLDTLSFIYPVVSDTYVWCSVQFQHSILL
jgi:hypothetical protein